MKAVIVHTPSNYRNLNGLEGASYVDKDLRRLLGDPVVAPFNLAYCGGGVLATCRDSLWQALHQAADTLAAQLGQPDPALWRRPASRTGFLRSSQTPSIQRPTRLSFSPTSSRR